MQRQPIYGEETVRYGKQIKYSADSILAPASAKTARLNSRVKRSPVMSDMKLMNSNSPAQTTRVESSQLRLPQARRPPEVQRIPHQVRQEESQASFIDNNNNNHKMRVHLQQQQQQHHRHPSEVMSPLVAQVQHQLQHHQPHLVPTAPQLNLKAPVIDFQAKLVETSQDVVHLLASYREEFRSLAVDLVWVAKQNTIKGLQRSSLNAQAAELRPQYEEATKRLYESILAHLNVSALNYNGSVNPEFEFSSSSSAQIDREINTFFRRLQLIQAKRLLDQTVPSGVVLECLEANLQSDKQIEQSLNEFSSQFDAAGLSGAFEQLKGELSLEKIRITSSIKQSLEFARTLLNSLHVSIEVFHNLTSQAGEWMSQGSCHAALAKLTSNLEEKQQQQVPLCEGFCLNVVRGCINDVYELNSFWAQHVNALARFKMNMIQTNNIENVMSYLDERLVGFMEKLHQQYTSTATTNHNHSKHLQSAGQWLFAASSSSSTTDQQTTISAKMGQLCQSRSTSVGGSPRQAEPRPASRILPATQKHSAPASMHSSTQAIPPGYLAQRARLSPAYSLFNRLDTFVHELSGSRDFFAEWPQRLCKRLRRPQLTATTGECWNGRDSTGYTKSLVEFGKPLTGAHPEVPVSEPVAVNPLVLNLVAKLKLVGAQLARKSVRAPSLFDTLPVVSGGSPVTGLDSTGAPVSAALARQLDTNANLMDHEQVGPDMGGSINALAAAAVAAAASKSDPASGPEEETEEKREEIEGRQEEAGGGGAGDEEEEDGGEPEEDEDDDSYNCRHSDCSDLLNNGTLFNGSDSQTPGLDLDASGSGLEFTPGLELTTPPYVIPKLPREKLNPVYPFPIQTNSPPRYSVGPGLYNQLNPASTASTQDTLVINLLLAMALGILLASLVCLRRLKLRF